jgi:hypothetical protein
MAGLQAFLYTKIYALQIVASFRQCCQDEIRVFSWNEVPNRTY